MSTQDLIQRVLDNHCILEDLEGDELLDVAYGLLDLLGERVPENTQS